MTAIAEAIPGLITNPSLSPSPCIMTVLRVLESGSGQVLRRQLANNALTAHALALTHSLEAEQQGYLSDVEVSDLITTPRIIGPEVICLMALARKQANRQLAPHPDDRTKRVMTTRS